MPRCPKGTRKNKSGDCVPKSDSTKKVRTTRKNTNVAEKQHAKDYKAAEKLFKQAFDINKKRYPLMQKHFQIELESKGNITELKRKSLKCKMNVVKEKLNMLIDKLDKLHNSPENEEIYNKLSFAELEELGNKYEYHF